MASGYNMHTDLSNSAIVLYALAQHDPGSPLVADTVRFLMSNRNADGRLVDHLHHRLDLDRPERSLERHR